VQELLADDLLRLRQATGEPRLFVVPDADLPEPSSTAAILRY